jgi:Ca-activated chloride channel family protein
MRRPWLLGVLVILVPAAIVGMVRAQSSTNDSGKSCAGHPTVQVLAAPAIAPALSNAGALWARQARPDGVCPSVQVTSRASLDAEAALAKSDVKTPDVWIPDSSQWIQRLRQDTEGEYTPVQSAWVSPPVASSPLVLACSPQRAAALGKIASSGWAALMSGKAGVAMVDPNRNTEGLLALLTAQTSISGNSTTPTRELVSSLVGLSRDVLHNTTDGLADIRSKPKSAAPFADSEQAIIKANGGRPPVVQAIYPHGQGTALDFPLVQFAPPAQDPAQRDATLNFASYLYKSRAQQEMRAIGLRDGVGHAFSSTVNFTGIAPTAVIRTLAAPSDDRVADALRVWTAAGRSNRTLVVIDVSGSMAASGKMRFASQAAKEVVDFLPDSSQLGLWRFSSKLAGSTPWRQVVSLGTIGAPYGNTSRRQALSASAAGLVATNGNTGLYRTTLAAYKTVRQGYQSDKLNSVVILTDGSDTEGGVTLPKLLSTLKAENNASRPVQIFTIAVGPDADVKTLKQISAATDGAEYTVDTASDTRSIFLDAVIKAGS